MSTIRLALFVCDAPVPEVQATDGHYPEIFGALWEKSFSNDQANASFKMDSFDVRFNPKYPEDVDQYDAIVYTGSGPLLLIALQLSAS